MKATHNQEYTQRNTIYFVGGSLLMAAGVFFLYQYKGLSTCSCLVPFLTFVFLKNIQHA